MITITREQLDRLYKKQKNIITSCTVMTTLCVMISVVIFRYAPSSLLTDLLAAAVFILPLIFIGVMRKRIFPPGNGKRVTEAMRLLQRDFISDNAVNILYAKMEQADSYPDRTKLKLLLCDIFCLRGQYGEAISLLGSVDRNEFGKYPEVGASFYDDTLSVYDEIGDSGSVLRAFNDAEPFIRHCIGGNFLCAQTAVNILIKAEKAKKNYRAALDLRLMKNEFDNLTMKTVTAQMGSTPLNTMITGQIFCETAELFFLCGDIGNAAKYIDIGGPMVTASPSALKKANKLSEKIREAEN